MARSVALRCVLYVYNRTLTQSTYPDERCKTLYELITRTKPELSTVRIFRTHGKVLKPIPYQKSKVDAKVRDTIHVGYALGDAYHAYIHELGRVFVSKDVALIKNCTVM